MRQTDPTPHEVEFFDELSRRVADLQDWYHEDADGTPWMCVSRDIVQDNAITATLRLDYDGRRLRGGWSPGFLNWDDGVRADSAGVDVLGTEGIAEDAETPVGAAIIAALWFGRVITAREGRHRW